MRARDTTFSFIQHFIAEVAGRPVGFCQFYCCGAAGEADYKAFPADSTFSLDYLIGSPTDLRRGYGRAMPTAAPSDSTHRTAIPIPAFPPLPALFPPQREMSRRYDMRFTARQATAFRNTPRDEDKMSSRCPNFK